MLILVVDLKAVCQLIKSKACQTIKERKKLNIYDPVDKHTHILRGSLENRFTFKGSLAPKTLRTLALMSAIFLKGLTNVKHVWRHCFLWKDQNSAKLWVSFKNIYKCKVPTDIAHVCVREIRMRFIQYILTPVLFLIMVSHIMLSSVFFHAVLFIRSHLNKVHSHPSWRRLEGKICFLLLRSALKQSHLCHPLCYRTNKMLLVCIAIMICLKEKQQWKTTIPRLWAPTICTNKHKNKQIVHYLLLKSIMCNFFIFLIMVLCNAWMGSLTTSPFLPTTTNRQKIEKKTRVHWDPCG